MFGKKSKQPALIFIAEDNAMYAKTVQLFLKEKFPSAAVEIFPVGELCIDNLHRNPDFVIMDYFLNSKFHDASDGLAMLKEIRAKSKHVHVIILSAQQDVGIAVDAMNEPKTNYVVKNEEAFGNLEKIIRAAFA